MNCPSCGATNDPWAMFCDNCATSLSSTPSPMPGTVIHSVQNRIDLQNHPDLLVSIGSAEDCIPWAISITRSSNITSSVHTLADSLGSSHPISRLLQSPLNAIELTLGGYWIQRDIYQLSLSSGVTLPCYISRKNLSEMLGLSLLAQLIPPLPTISTVGEQSQKAVATSTQRLAATQRRVAGQSALSSQVLASTGGQNRFLALSIKDERVFVTGWKDENKRDVPVLQREFVSESLSAFSDCTFQILKRNRTNYHLPTVSVAEGNIKTFPTAMRELLDMGGNDGSGTYFEPKFIIPYASVAKVIVEIARSLEEGYHRSGKVHGDLKPQNVLIASQRP